ncbi:hypothetical protein RI367_001432 [Sorochytrium milnesiophthora]
MSYSQQQRQQHMSQEDLLMQQQQQQQQNYEMAHFPSPGSHLGTPQGTPMAQHMQMPHYDTEQQMEDPYFQHYYNIPNDASSAYVDMHAPEFKTVRRNVRLQNHQVIVDLPIAPDVLIGAKYQGGGDPRSPDHNEFTAVRYTACTAKPDDFVRDGYSLRQAIYGRQTELFIVVTMYNEDEILFTRTMQAINKNIQHMCAKKTGPFAGEFGWQKIVVCIVSDGRQKINKNVLKVLAGMGVYQDGVCVPKVADKDIEAHVFEYTTQINITDKMDFQTWQSHKVVPMQILFCLKEKNKKKINSHRWFFKAFGPVLEPNVCVLIDVGTKPRTEAIYRLWRCFDVDKQVGGACGEIAVEWDNLLHLMKPIIAAQNFEYKMSNILDKPLESVCGYISVLPGAFSAYRYRALQGRPLESYFKGETLEESGDVFQANMYLAEDRILCFELVAKVGENWVLRYEKDSQAITDVPDGFPEFISQRRRWLNGSTFALLYALGNVGRIYGSGQSIGRMLLFTLEFLYMAVNFVFSYISLANFYLAFHFLTQQFIDSMKDANVGGSHPGIPSITTPVGTAVSSLLLVLRGVYILSIATTFIAALGNRPQAAKAIYLLSISLFSLITLVMLYIMIVSIIGSFLVVTSWQSFRELLPQTPALVGFLISLASTFGIYTLASVLFMDPWHMITCFAQYMLLLPTYVNVLQIYAYCNISDVTWGTKGDNGAGAAAGGAKVTKADNGEEMAMLFLPPSDPESLSSAYRSQKNAVLDLLRKRNEEEKKSNPSNDDLFRKFRTVWLLLWIIINGGLIAILVSPDTLNINRPSSASTPGFNLSTVYLTGLFWAVAGFAVVRFAGSSAYLISRSLPNFLNKRGQSSR